MLHCNISTLHEFKMKLLSRSKSLLIALENKNVLVCVIVICLTICIFIVLFSAVDLRMCLRLS